MAYTRLYTDNWDRRYVVGNDSGEFSVEFRRFGNCRKTRSLHEAKIFNSLDSALTVARMWSIKEKDGHVRQTGWRPLPIRIEIMTEEDLRLEEAEKDAEEVNPPVIDTPTGDGDKDDPLNNPTDTPQPPQDDDEYIDDGVGDGGFL